VKRVASATHKINIARGAPERELKNAADNGGHPVVVELKRGSDGVWRGERDIRLQAVK